MSNKEQERKLLKKRLKIVKDHFNRTILEGDLTTESCSGKRVRFDYQHTTKTYKVLVGGEYVYSSKNLEKAYSRFLKEMLPKAADYFLKGN